MLTEAKPGSRVKHSRLGKGTILPRTKGPDNHADFDECKICYVQFDSLPEGYSNPFLLDWERLTHIWTRV